MVFKEACKTGRHIVIVGAGVQGEVILRLLEAQGIQPACFGDNDKAKQGQPYYGYSVLSLEDISFFYPNAIIIIAAVWHYPEIHKMLLDAGYVDLYKDTDLLETIELNSLTPDKRRAVAWKLAEHGYLDKSTFYLPRLNLVLTTRCTLKCDRCSSLMPEYTQPKDIETFILLRSMQRLFDNVDYIGRMEVLGGEPFLHPQWDMVVETLAKSDKVFQIDIVTNGTIVPPDAMLNRIKYPHVRLSVNNYGRLSSKYESLIVKCKQLGINCLAHKHWKWAELGDFRFRCKTVEQLTNLFKACSNSACTEIIDGKMYRCSRSSHGATLGIVPYTENDYVDLLSQPTREGLIEFFKKPFVTACNYCDGNIEGTLILQPAIQRKT